MPRALVYLTILLSAEAASARINSPRPAPPSATVMVLRALPPAVPLGHVGVTAVPMSQVQLQPWHEGAVTRLQASPGRVSLVLLQPGEALVSVAAGDTARWIIGDSSSGSGAARRVHLLVKPTEAGLRTNLVIATDRRVYLVDVVSNAAATTTVIAWTYPADALLALQQATAKTAEARSVAEGLRIDQLNFNYALTGDRPAWRPLRVFDDGQQVLIEFPAGLGSLEAPPLFVLGDRGEAELVNYRQRGRYYIVDRLFARAELRLGGRRQQVVRIERSSTSAPTGRKG